VPHDEHFLQRLDRLSSSHEDLDLALGLYRDHELVKFVLDQVRLPDGAERVAIALADRPDSPHVIVARDGHFVTCLGDGMKTGPHPVVPRARLDGLASKLDRVREGLALARRSGMDSTKLLTKMTTVGPAVSREDYLAAEATLGPASPLLLQHWYGWWKLLDLIYAPLLRASTPAQVRHPIERDLVRAAWGAMHTAMLLNDTATREWIDQWAANDLWSERSAWTAFVGMCALPFAVRAAWIGARLGKPMLPSYKARYAAPPDAGEMREAGWGLVAMGLRHQGLRAEIWRVLLGRKAAAQEAPWVETVAAIFRDAAKRLDEDQQGVHREGMNEGRRLAVELTARLPESSEQRLATAEQVSEPVALAALVGAWEDAIHGEDADRRMLQAVTCSARARGADFYLPEAIVQALGPPDSQQLGAALVEMRKKLIGEQLKPAVRDKTPGRNDPCSCGSGKKYKKCCGR